MFEKSRFEVYKHYKLIIVKKFEETKEKKSRKLLVHYV